MTVFFPFGETWVRLRAKKVASGYGNATTLDWSDPATENVGPCAVGGLSSSLTTAADLVEVGSLRTLHVPPGSDIKIGDRLRDPQDRVWTVEGVPDEPTHPLTGWQPGMVVTIRHGTP